MRRHTAALAAAALTTALLTACSSGSDDTSKPHTAACKAAMQKQLADAIDTSAEGQRPPECAGIDDETLQRLMGDTISDRLGQDTEDALQDVTEDSQTTEDIPITDECRAWIESELQDDTDSIDADAGETACVGLSDAELNEAIDAVTNELLEQDTP